MNVSEYYIKTNKRELMVTIQNQITKKHGKKIGVTCTKTDGFGFDINNKFNTSAEATKFLRKVNRRHKLRGKQYFIATAMIKKASTELLTDKLKNKFNGGI